MAEIDKTAAVRDNVFIHRSEGDQQWYWHRVAANNEVISDGEGYTEKSGAITGARRANPDLPDDSFHVAEVTNQ